jgi:hypothetical protein
MSSSNRWFLLGGVALLLVGMAQQAQAQVLIWSLPAADGTWVRFEGTYRNKEVRPQAPEGDLEVESRCELTIKSVKTETLEIDGKALKCRWLEFKTVIGKPSEQGIQPGPYGTRIYKVLVDETKVDGKIADARGIPNTFFPIIKGYRKLGNRELETIREKSVMFYPMISLVTHYPDLKAEGDKATLDLPLGAVSAQLMRGTQSLVSSTDRSLNEGSLWLSPDVPFGLAKFLVKVTREKKDSTAPKDDFKRTADLQMEMSAVAKGTDARSELATP